MDGGLEIVDVSLRTANQQLVDALSLAVAPGETVTLMGPSGCGKSSLLAWISGAGEAGIEAQGRVRLDRVDITKLPPERRKIGVLFQDDMLFPHLSVAENLIFAIPRNGQTRTARRQAAIAALDEIGLADLADRDPTTLSGGQRARVALMRALLAQPKAILLDEPFSALDRPLRDDMRRLVFARIASSALPAILVTHDEADAEAAGGRVLRLWDDA